MTAIANFVGFQAERPAPVLAVIAGRIGGALKRAARGRYAEQRARLADTGLAGMI